jgi:hypothetical protein
LACGRPGPQAAALAEASVEQVPLSQQSEAGLPAGLQQPQRAAAMFVPQGAQAA